MAASKYRLNTPPPIPGGITQTSQPKSKWKRVVLYILIIVSVILASGGAVYWEDTLVAWWLPVVIALAASAIASLPGIKFWRYITGYHKIWLNEIIHLLCFGSLIYFLLLFSNYKGAEFNSGSQPLDARIVRKYTVEHIRRQGRRYYGNRSKYNTWHITLCLPDGRNKNHQVSLTQYNKLRTGNTIQVEVTPGLLGWDVMTFSRHSGD